MFRKWVKVVNFLNKTVEFRLQIGGHCTLKVDINARLSCMQESGNQKLNLPSMISIFKWSLILGSCLHHTSMRQICRID